MYVSITSAVRTSPTGMVTCRPLPVTPTSTVLVLPSTVSLTRHVAPAGMPSYVRDEVPDAPRRITKSGRAPVSRSQLTAIRTSPCSPAADPLIVLCTTSEPGGGIAYVSVIPTVASPPAGIVTSRPLPLTATVTASVCPSTVSVTVHTAPTGSAE